jgi:hypothetical protein
MTSGMFASVLAVRCFPLGLLALFEVRRDLTLERDELLAVVTLIVGRGSNVGSYCVGHGMMMISMRDGDPAPRSRAKRGKVPE